MNTLDLDPRDADSGSGSRSYKITIEFKNIEYFLNISLTLFVGI